MILRNEAVTAYPPQRRVSSIRCESCRVLFAVSLLSEVQPRGLYVMAEAAMVRHCPFCGQINLLAPRTNLDIERQKETEKQQPCIT